MEVDPVCAFHGLRASEHRHGRCLFCCLCFRTLEPEDCWQDADGQRWDICEDCAAEEEAFRAEYPYVFSWGNNEWRAKHKGQRCRVLARGRLRSVLVEFHWGAKAVTSDRALRLQGAPGSPTASRSPGASPGA